MITQKSWSGKGEACVRLPLGEVSLLECFPRDIIHHSHGQDATLNRKKNNEKIRIWSHLDLLKRVRIKNIFSLPVSCRYSICRLDNFLQQVRSRINFHYLKGPEPEPTKKAHIIAHVRTNFFITEVLLQVLWSRWSRNYFVDPNQK